MPTGVDVDLREPGLSHSRIGTGPFLRAPDLAEGLVPAGRGQQRGIDPVPVDQLGGLGVQRLRLRGGVRLVDDVDGGEADESVSFGIDGRSLEIDFSKAIAEKLRGVFAPYIAATQRGGRQPARQQRVQRQPAGRRIERQPSPNTPTSPREDTGQVRAWAAANGFTVSARGRISSVVMQAYRNRSAGTQKPALPKVGNPFQANAS
jgi:hypothetical protein